MAELDIALKLLVSLAIASVLALALFDCASQWPQVRRLALPAIRFTSVPYAVFAALLVTAFFVAKDTPALMASYRTLAAPDLMMMLFVPGMLAAGSRRVWRQGLRGKGFGWLGLWRAPHRRIPALPWALGAAGAIGLTVALAMTGRFGVSAQTAHEIGPLSAAGPALNVLIAAKLMIAPFEEEVIFRHYFQPRAIEWLGARGWHWIAGCVASAALWSLSHVGIASSDWIKLAQIFPIGLMLGFMQRRWGVSVCIAVHLALNLAVLALVRHIA